MKKSEMPEEERLLKIIVFSNWILLAVLTVGGVLLRTWDFGWGVFAGGLIISINFHFLYRTLKKSLDPLQLSSPGIILGKYYIRFLISALIIFVLISEHYVEPLGLILGLSIIVISLLVGLVYEVKENFFRGVV
ncbi:MAG: ATP synthase subunit I [Deltaproteobacteria bacterium]|nr:ATP synthase subunit I [Deltaproteobacteria bacterium]